MDLYATNPRGWDHTDVCALQTYAGVVAGLLGTAAKAHIGGLADQVQVALASRVPRPRPDHGSGVAGVQPPA